MLKGSPRSINPVVEMAQPSGYPSIPSSGPGGPVGSSVIPNGQPPQWNKPPAFPATKSPRPYMNQHYPNATNPISSNGTPTPQHYSNPGSISSQSSRDPSPVPPNRLGSVSQSLENLSHSTSNLNSFGNSHSARVTPGMSPVPPDVQQVPQGTSPVLSQLHGSQTLAQTVPNTLNPSQQLRSQNAASIQGSIGNQYYRGDRSHISNLQSVGPPNSASLSRMPQQNRTGSLQDIPSQSVPNANLQQHRVGPVSSEQEDRKPGVSSRSTPTHLEQRYPFTSSSASQLQMMAPQTSVNGPTGVPVPRTNVQGMSSLNHQGQFSEVQSPTGIPPPSVSGMGKPAMVPTSQSAPFSTIPPGGVRQSQAGQSGHFPGVPLISSGMKHPPTNQPAQFSSTPPVSGVAQILNQGGQYPGVSQSGSQPPATSQASQPPPTSQASQPPPMPSTSHLGRFSGVPHTSQPGQYSNMPLSPAVLPTSQTYPGIPPTSQSAQYSNMGAGTRPSIPSLNQPGQYSNMPPTSQAGQYPTMPPASQSGQYPNMPLNSQPGQSPSMPPTNQTGQYPNMPLTSHSRQYSSLPSTNQLGQYPSTPPTSQPGQNTVLPSVGQLGQYSGVPPNGQQGQYPPMSQVSPATQYPGMPPLQSGPGLLNQYPTATQQESTHLAKRYPPQQDYSQQPLPGADGLSAPMSNLSVTQAGFNKLWGLECYDLLQTRNILPPDKIEPPQVRLHQEFLDNVNCSSEIFRCTLTKIPETNSLLQKSRLPLGILVHPFKDLNHLPVIQCSTIVRCRACRTYINPFVYFVDHKRWKCNLCFRVNELPEEFQYDPVSKTYGDPTRRPEIKSSTIEFIAPSEYMLRPPQPAVYLFLLDVSRLGVECGYLQLFCDVLLDELDKLPGDGRTQVGFITYDSHIHFYNMAEGLSQPQQMIVVDTDDIFLPCPDNLLVNLAESRELVRDLLHQLPHKFHESHDTSSALGPALQAAYKLMAPTGGRVTVFQACLPTLGPGGLTAREDPSQRAGKEAPHLNPATDFYKRLALDCSGQQVAVDLFLVNSQYCDLATLSGVSRFSGGCIHHFPLFKATNILQAESLERAFRRYLTRKIGFEAVMRIRCSRGLAIHTFHGNFFVRSTDLLSLPNVNPDAGFGMQVSVEESLAEVQNVCFQAALLYTTSKGERRIRVHTLCLPVATTLSDILHAADQQCIVGLLAKMAVDRSHQSSLSDARDAFINVAIDVLSAYHLVQSGGNSSGLLSPFSLRLLPLYILALLKYVAFRTGQSTRLDDRLFAMCQMKSLPLTALIQAIYPDLYPVHCLEEQLVLAEDGSSVPQPPRLHLSAEKLDFRGVFLLDMGEHMMMYVGRNVSTEFCTDVIGVSSYGLIPDEMYELPVLETTKSVHLRNFINHLQSERPYCATFEVIRDDGKHRTRFTERLIEDRSESALSYYEFLQHLKSNVK